MHRFLFILPVFLLTFSGAAGQQNTYISYNTSDGLAQSQVRAIAQDQRGYIWFGTLGGLSRFDGHEFKSYSRENGLPDNQINSLLQGRSRFWIGTTGAICYVDGIGIKTIPLPESFHSSRVFDMVETPDKGLWLGLAGEGLLHWDGNTFMHFDRSKGLPDNYIRSLAYAPNGDLWIGTRSGMVIYDGALIKKPIHPELENASVSDILVASSGTIYVCTFETGIYEIEDDSLRQLRMDDGLMNNSIRCAAELENGEVWFGSVSGLNRLYNGQLSAIGEDEGLPYVNIKSFGTDREGNLWIGTDGQGAFRQAGKAFTIFTTADGMLSDVAMDITRRKAGNLIIGSYDQGLTVYDGRQFTPYPYNDLLPNKAIWKLETDENNGLWAGTSGGLFIERYGQTKTVTASDGLPGNRITALLKDEQKIWVGAENGFAQLDLSGNIQKVFDLQNGFEGKRIRTLLKKDNGLWIGAEGMLIRYADESFTTILLEDQDDAAIYCIAADADHNLWVGTSSGLYVLHTDKMTLEPIVFSTNFSARNINFMQVLKDRMLLLGTNNGLYRMDLTAYAENGKVRTKHFTAFEGLKSSETNQNAVYADGDYVWFGTTLGLVRFEPFQENFSKEVAPKTNLTAVQLFLQDVNWSDRKDSISHFTGLPVSPVFRHDENYLTFNYSGIYFSNPDKVKYRYKLEGADSEWLGPTRSRSATYAYLPHGEYTFLLEAYSDDDLDQVDQVSFPFRITPPFYLTIWFFILIAVLLILIIYLIYKRRLHKEIEKQANLHIKFQSRMLELESQTLNSSMNRHFIFNALNSIQYYINMQDKRSANRYLTSFAKLIRMNLDSSQQTLTRLKDELERLELYLSLEQMRFQGRFDYEIKIEAGLDLSDVDIPAMMLQPFLENSIWHGILPAEKHGIISVEISAHADYYRIEINDNGIGVEISRNQKISDNTGHISKGMEITQSRIMLYKRMTGLNYHITGPDQVTSEAGNIIGTRVIIFLPKHTKSEISEISSPVSVEI